MDCCCDSFRHLELPRTNPPPEHQELQQDRSEFLAPDRDLPPKQPRSLTFLDMPKK